MKKSSNYLLFFFIFLFLLIICSSIENYENIYESNQVLPDQPDDKQFYACRQKKFTNDEDYPYQQYPNSNYRVIKNQVSKPLQGTYSAFLDVNQIRTYDHFYHSPICEDDIILNEDGTIKDNHSFIFNTDINSQFRLIPGAFPEEDKSILYENELKKDSHDLRNPYFFYGNPKYIQNKIIYDDEINTMFLNVKQGLDSHLEDSSHYQGIESRYNP
tara:strand:- start:1211 stop:1855 length:645 start_codon:yes stop_codon:yes gene_type:complete